MRFAQEISVFNPFAIERAVIGLSTSITQTSERIELQAQEIAVMDGKVETATASLTVMAQEIESKVSSDDVVSIINQSAQQITIQSNRIQIDSTNFHLTTDGQITATRGIIGSQSASTANRWTIGGDTSRAWIYSGSKSTFSSRSTAGTYIGTDGISMRGTESNVNNFLELQNGIVKTSCIQVYDGGGSNYANILLDDDHKISVPYGLTTGDADNPRINYFKNTTYCKGDLVLAGELECAAGRTTDVTSEDNEGGGRMRFRRASSGGLDYVQFECPVWNNNSETVFTSDRRLKDEIEDLDKEEIRDFLMKLKPSSFVFRNDDKRKTHHGVIAQDVLQIAEDNPYVSIVKDDEGNELYTVAYMEFIADIIAVLQLQQYEIDRYMRGAE